MRISGTWAPYTDICIEIHVSVYICHTSGMGYVYRQWVHGGLKGSPAVTLSHDAGQRFKSMG